VRGNPRRGVAAVVSIVLFLGVTGLTGLATIATAPLAQAAPIQVPTWVTRLPASPGPNWFPGLVDASRTYDVYRDNLGRDLLLDAAGNPIPNGEAIWKQTLAQRIAPPVAGSTGMITSSFDHANWVTDKQIPSPVMALKGDTVNFYGGTAYGQQGGTHPDETVTGVFSMKNDFTATGGQTYPQFFGEILYDDSITRPRLTTEYWQGEGDCAQGTPTINRAGTVYNMWCLGIGTFRLTYSPADGMIDPNTGEYIYDPNDPSDDDDSSYTLRFAFGPIEEAIEQSFFPTSRVKYLAGPNNLETGAAGTGTGTLLVFAPRLQLVKEVCVSGTDCDPKLGTQDDKDNSTYDSTTGRWTIADQDNMPVPDSMDNTTGEWVDVANLPLGTTQVQWRIAVKNTGNVVLNNVHMANDKQSTDPDFPGDAGLVQANNCLSQRFITKDPETGLARPDGVLYPGESAYITCITDLTGDLGGGALINEANANASLPDTIPCEHGDPNQAFVDASLLDEHGQPLANRLEGNTEQSGASAARMIPSNNDAAMVTMPQPGLKLTKWVCGNDNKCEVPPSGSPELQQLAGYDSTASKLVNRLTEGQQTEYPAGSGNWWVKSATLPYDSTAKWLLVVTNTGNTAMRNVSIPVDTATGIADARTTVEPASVPLLNPGDSVTFTLTSPHVMDTGAFDNCYSPTDPNACRTGTPDKKSGERAYQTGDDLVNVAQAQGTPASTTTGTILTKPDGSLVGPMRSNWSEAEARTDPPAPGISLTKWVCGNLPSGATQTQCEDPTTADVTKMAGVTWDATGTATVGTGTASGGWVKQMTVPYGTHAEWLIVVTNTGNTFLSGVKLSDEVQTGVGGGTTTCAPATPVIALMAPQTSVAVRCTNDIITNTNAFTAADPNGPVVNTAQASGDASNDQGTLFPDPDKPIPSPPWTITSNHDSAKVRTETPTPGIALTKWVCGTLAADGKSTQCADPNATDLGTLAGVTWDAATKLGTFVQPDAAGAGGWVKAYTVPYNTKAQWLLVITNTGDMALSHVNLYIESITGAGFTKEDAGAFKKCVTNAPVTNVLPPGATVTVTCEIDGVTNTAALDATNDIVNRAAAEGTPSGSDGQDLPQPNGTAGPWAPIHSTQDQAEVNTKVNVGISLVKMVCNELTRTTDCVVPAADDVSAASLAAKGWVKSTTVAYNTDAQWLIVVTNTGDEDLANVSLVKETLSGKGQGGNSAACAEGVEIPGILKAKASAVITCTVAGITNTSAWGTNGDPATTQDVLNIAQAAGNPVDSAGQLLPKPNTTVLPNPANPATMWNVESNTDWAEVNTTLPKAEIGLEKYVCDGSATCDVPTVITPASLAAAKWVPATTVPYNTTAKWLIVITNTGDVTLSDVTLTKDVVTGLGHGATSTGCDQGTVLPGTLAPGAMGAITCTTTNITNTNAHGAADVVNTAKSSGRPVDDQDEYYPKPNDEPGDWVVESPEDSAEVNTTAPEPGMKVTKWVCSELTPDKKATACPDPTVADLAKLSGVSVDATGKVVVTPGQPTGGWVKAGTVPYNTDAKWLVVVSNTGETYLSNTHLNIETVAGVGRVGPDHPVVAPIVDLTAPGDLLAPGESAYFKLTTEKITNTQTAGPGWSGDTNNKFREATYVPGSDVVNTAQATATPVQDPVPGVTGTPERIPLPNSNPGEDKWIADVTSNTALAEARTDPLTPALSLQKLVCMEGTGCTAPTDTGLLETLAGGGIGGGWVSATTVDYKTDAQWLIVVENTGTTRIDDVRLIFEEMTGGGHGALSGCSTVATQADSLVATTMEVGDIAVLATCRTAAITNGEALGSGKDVVNTAQVDGLPVDDSGNPIPKPDGQTGDLPRVPSNKDSADVNTVIPKPQVDIEKYDMLGTDDISTGDFDSTAKVLHAAVDTPMEFKVTNTGEESLIDVKVSDRTIAGTGVIKDLVCDFSELDDTAVAGTEWAGPFKVGDSFTCTGVLPGLAVGAKHTDEATVVATGVLTGNGVSDTDKWNGNVPTVANIATGGTALQDAVAQRYLMAALLTLGLIGVIAIPIWRKRTTR